MGQPRPLFVYFKYYKTQILQKKTEGFSRIRTRIVRVEGDHADHLTTTTAQLNILWFNKQFDSKAVFTIIIRI